MSGLFVDTVAAAAAAEELRAVTADAAPALSAVDAGNSAATEAIALLASSVASFHAAFATHTTVVATAVELGAADTAAADGAGRE